MTAKLPSSRKYGFTLIEVVIVMIVMGIMTAVATPRYRSTIARYRAEAAAKRIASDLNYARAEAIHQGVNQQVTFDTSFDSYSLPGLPHINRPSEVYSVSLAETSYPANITTADFAGNPSVTFDIYGQPDFTGSVIVVSGNAQEIVVLDVVTGRASVQ